MANTKYIVAASLVGAALLGTPLLISQGVDAQIENNRVNLEKNGLTQTITAKNGYFATERSFTLEVSDAAKARDYLLDMLVAKNAQYKIFAKGMKEIDATELNAALNGLSFKGIMQNSNLLPQESTMSLILEKLPSSMHKEITDSKELQTTILPLLEKGAIAFDLVFDSRQKLSSVHMRDMKEALKFEEGTFTIDTHNQGMSFKDEGSAIKGKAEIDKQHIGATSEAFILQSHLDNFAYDFNYKDDFNNQGLLSVGAYKLRVEESSNTMEMSLGKIEASSKLEESQQALTLNAMYTFNDLSFVDKRDTIKLKKLGVNLTLSGVAIAKLKKLQNDYNALMLGANGPSDQELIADFVALINDGVVLDLSVKANGLEGEIALKDVSVTMNASIPKNSYTDKQSPLALLSLLDIKASVKMHKDDRKMLEDLEMSVEEDFALGKADGDYFIYDITFKESKISVNGSLIQ